MKKLLVLSTVMLFYVFCGTIQADLYIPHVDTNAPWQTEVTFIHTGKSQVLIGTLNGYGNDGTLIESIDVSFGPHGRKQLDVSKAFDHATDIGYLMLDLDAEEIQGYVKFFQPGKYSVAIPAVSHINTGDIYIPHIASVADEWWTGISLVNTNAAPVTLTITFDTGETVDMTLSAGEHRAFTVASLFDGVSRPDIGSAVITHAPRVLGLELFGNLGDGNRLSGILLTDKTENALFYPHLAENETWWTGIVAYNPSDAVNGITVVPYADDGSELTPRQTFDLNPTEKYIGTVGTLSLPSGTAWFKVQADSRITGFQLFGTNDLNQLAGYSNTGLSTPSGVFPKIEKDGWTGIAFVNTEDHEVYANLVAYDNRGTSVAERTITLPGFAKVVGLAEQLFPQDDINQATYIAYASVGELVGFQLNGSSDGMMLDGLPVLPARHYPEDLDYDGDGYTENQGDCDDTDPGVYPGAPEICEDGIDQDCNTKDLSCNDVDDDGDGYTENQGDCDDTDPDVWQTLTGYSDADGDKFYTNGAAAVFFCAGDVLPFGYGTYAGDCNDFDSTIHPYAFEISDDGIDNNCNGEIDEIPVCGVAVLSYTPTFEVYYARPIISAEFVSTCGYDLNPSSVEMQVDDIVVPASKEITPVGMLVTYQPEIPLAAYDNHSVQISIEDIYGARGEQAWSFWVIPPDY